MLEPQSVLVFVLLVVVFGALIWWGMRTRHVVLKITAACLSFVMAMAFGVLSVNKYFGYYTTWGAAVLDFSNSSPNAGQQVTQNSLLEGRNSLAVGQQHIYLKLAVQQGYTMSLPIAGKLSHITRRAYVYLPPQYFERQYAGYRFPVIELIHGQPGEPQSWINVLGIELTLNQMIKTGQAQPAVLVMPDANGGNNSSLQCLNQVGGPQDLTYLAQDVPDAIARLLRVQPPGIAWGIAGYSEGGFCAANMALHYRAGYGYVASLSGYYVPYLNKIDNRLVSPFGNDTTLRLQNTPIDEIRIVPPGARLPQFWLGAEAGNWTDLVQAEYFGQELQLHEANVPLVLTPGSAHTMTTWRAQLPSMLSWMTHGLATSVDYISSQGARAKGSDTAAGHRPGGATLPLAAKEHQRPAA